LSAEPRVLADRYRIEELIGQGGMARVYRAHDLKLGRDVAVKVLEGTLADDEEFRARFRAEAKAASRMSHPTIVRVYDAGEPIEGQDEPPFIVMELVDGKLLKEVIDEGPVPLSDAVRYVDGILQALEYSHRAGVIHRDIKPGNVMVTSSGSIKVMDFGIARAVSESSATVIETARIIGTAAYLSPEQARGDAVDARADLYSVGVVLYELLTGQPPFRGESPVAVAYQHVSEDPPLPTEVNDAAPGALNPIVLKALAKDPEQRYADAASFRAALAASLTARAPSKRKIAALTQDLYSSNPRHTEQTLRSLRGDSTEKVRKRASSRMTLAMVWTGVALIAIIAGILISWALSVRAAQNATYPIPQLSGVSFEQAETELEALNLLAKKVFEPSDTVPEGFVIRTNPVAQTSVKRGTEVTVYVSSGILLVKVPELTGLSTADARAALQAVGLALGSTTQRNDPHLAAGTVMEASLPPDTEVRPNTVVNLVVASGRVTVADLTGFVLTTAIKQLEDLGLKAATTADPNCPETSPQTVWTMSVPPGDVDIHSTVTLRYCVGD
jgi:serine/threonine protein kinase